MVLGLAVGVHPALDRAESLIQEPVLQTAALEVILEFAVAKYQQFAIHNDSGRGSLRERFRVIVGHLAKTDFASGLKEFTPCNALRRACSLNGAVCCGKVPSTSW